MAPSMVIVPGSFGRSDMYDMVVHPLRSKGYDIHALDPPCYPASYKKGAPLSSMYKDAAFIAAYVEKLADQGKDVVIFAHSYGGLPASESLKDITKTAREAQGKKGGVVHIGYLTAIVPDVGQTLPDVLKGGAPNIAVDEEGWLYHTDYTITANLCFNSLPLDDALPLARQLTKHSSRAFADALSYPGYRDVSVSWFFCERDQCVSPEVQQTAIDVIEASWKGTQREGKKVDVTRVKCDHVPNYSARDEMEKWMEGLFSKN